MSKGKEESRTEEKNTALPASRMQLFSNNNKIKIHCHNKDLHCTELKSSIYVVMECHIGVCFSIRL